MVRTGHPLWGLLVPSQLSQNRASTASSAPRLTPSDKNAAALRGLLHDAKATLEGFSDRLGALTTDVKTTMKDTTGLAKSVETSQEQHLTQIVSASAFQAL